MYKTLRKASTRSFALLPFCEWEVCPVNSISYYLSACDLLKVRLAPVIFSLEFFTAIKMLVSDLLLARRFRRYLFDSKLFEGETPSPLPPISFHVGLSNTLRLLACLPLDVAQYIGWQSKEMAEHYSARMSEMVASLAIL